MLTGEEVVEIGVLHRQGKSSRAIARDQKISRETVRKDLREPGLEAGYGPRAPRPSKLDPFRDDIRIRIGQAAPGRLPATVCLREIGELRHDGGICVLKDWLAGEYPQLPAPEIVRFETPPGTQAQADRTSIRRGGNKLSAFVGRPGFSRFTLVRFADNERFETPVDAHERFFDAIGVPQTILHDSDH